MDRMTIRIWPFLSTLDDGGQVTYLCKDAGSKHVFYCRVKDVPISVKEFLSYNQGADVESVLTAVKLNGPDVINKTLSVLSGSQLRRVLVAWALIDNPDVLLFDEPTVGVDIGGEESIFSTLKDLKDKRNITLLLITHDIHL